VLSSIASSSPETSQISAEDGEEERGEASEISAEDEK